MSCLLGLVVYTFEVCLCPCRVNCESALASVVLSVSSDRLESIRDDLYCDFVFHPDALFPCDGPGLVPKGVLKSAVSLRLLLWCCLCPRLVGDRQIVVCWD